MTIGVIAVVLAIALPAIRAVRGSARAAACGSNLRQLGVAFETLHVTPGTPLPYFVTGLPASPPVGRLGIRDVFPAESFGDTIYCPSDRRLEPRPDSSYWYEPGEEMYDQALRGDLEPARTVTRWYDQYYTVYTVLEDDEPWHNDSRNTLIAPGWHVERVGD